ncbi:hypothetical protein [Fusobacterium sp.]|uniref:hypothetical protein n=1 Tax=Fusobacterium sp. TaxID=68766 RepID=UPI0026199A5E|nr:hypothetical protein [Fusobacterium sp.]
MLDLLKKLDTEMYDIVCNKKVYYNVKISEIKDNFMLIETKKGDKIILNLSLISSISAGKDLAFGTIPKNIKL